MILLKINAVSIFTFELKGYTPWTVDVDTVPYRIVPPKRMKVIALDIHVFRLFGLIECFQP